MTADDGAAITTKDSAITVASGWTYIKHEGYYLDVKWGNSASQTPVWTWGFTDTSAQHWTYFPATKIIKNENGKCLDIQWNGTADGTPVWIWDCNNGPAQQWTFVPKGIGAFEIKSANGKCLHVPGNQPQQQLQIWTCNGSAHQRWSTTGQP
jgi:hypothetical protein